jgi:hypothetical protein
MNISKEDWELYKEKLPVWQERYTKGLLEDYVKFLEGDGQALEKFHILEKKIKADKNTPGVQLRNTRGSRQGTDYNLMQLILANVISFDDLDGFSEEIKATVSKLVKAFSE